MEQTPDNSTNSTLQKRKNPKTDAVPRTAQLHCVHSRCMHPIFEAVGRYWINQSKIREGQIFRGIIREWKVNHPKGSSRTFTILLGEYIKEAIEAHRLEVHPEISFYEFVGRDHENQVLPLMEWVVEDMHANHIYFFHSGRILGKPTVAELIQDEPEITDADLEYFQALFGNGDFGDDNSEPTRDYDIPY